MLRTRLAGMLHKEADELQSHWDLILTDSNSSAYNEILSRLLARGYTKVQIDSWDRGAEFQRMIGLYRCLIQGVTGEAYDDKWPEKLTYWLEQLDTVLLIAGGALVADGTATDIGHGPQSTGRDIFVVDPDSNLVGEDRGTITKW